MKIIRGRSFHVSLLLFSLVFVLMVNLVMSYDFSIHKKTIGPQNVAVIAVEFTDKPALTSISAIEQRVFIEMRDYYLNVSYNKLSIIGDVYEFWVLLPHNMSYYGDYDNRNEHSEGARLLIRDAIKNSDDFIDFSTFDRILIVHAGENEAKSKEESDLWSWGFWEGLSASTADGVTFDQGALVSEFDSLGSFCHEFGHVLGLPDLHNVDLNSSTTFVEKWGLMGKGAHNGYPKVGSKPSHILSWGKLFLGWIDSSQALETNLDCSTIVTLEPLEELSDGIKVVKVLLGHDCYYLAEFRIDDYLPGQGVLITLVNETKASGEGIVKVVDSRSSTLTLDDACFHIGDIYEDTKNQMTFRILEQTENSAQIEISNKLVPYTKIRSPNEIEAYENALIEVEVTSYNGTLLSELAVTLFVDGHQKKTTLTDVNGIARFNVSFNLLTLGKRSLEVYINGGDNYLDIQTSVHFIEVNFPRWFFVLLFILPFLLIVVFLYLRTRIVRRYQRTSKRDLERGIH